MLQPCEPPPRGPAHQRPCHATPTRMGAGMDAGPCLWGTMPLLRSVAFLSPPFAWPDAATRSREGHAHSPHKPAASDADDDREQRGPPRGGIDPSGTRKTNDPAAEFGGRRPPRRLWRMKPRRKARERAGRGRWRRKEKTARGKEVGAERSEASRRAEPKARLREGRQRDAHHPGRRANPEWEGRRRRKKRQRGRLWRRGGGGPPRPPALATTDDHPQEEEPEEPEEEDAYSTGSRRRWPPVEPPGMGPEPPAAWSGSPSWSDR